ncbi:histidine phosphatase family protein, partial [Bacillus sp. S34]|nr:histidine phosphatase family protein [Bacillus sp. S34]
MPASRIHLVRHGEVHNPDRVLYGRLPGFGLSDLGKQMALASATAWKDAGVDVRRIVASPLQRTQESAAPWSEAFGLDVALDERLDRAAEFCRAYELDARSRELLAETMTGAL